MKGRVEGFQRERVVVNTSVFWCDLIGRVILHSLVGRFSDEPNASEQLPQLTMLACIWFIDETTRPLEVG